MQDRFKFRVWEKPTKKMYEVWSFDKDFVRATPSLVVTSVRTLNTKDCILLQSTGLKDKNGKLIYENDVVIWNNKKHLITWNEHMCSFILQTSNYDETDVLEFYMTDVQDLEIIGNIYTNPELLEVKE